MFVSPHALVRVRAARFVKCGVALSFAVLLAACSSSRQYSGPQVFSWLQPEPAVPAYAVAEAGEVDDEGLPVQAPPSGIRKLPDDLSQPWRRNYGRQGVSPESGAGEARVEREDWIAITQNDGFAEASIDDEGLPVPIGPEEAGEPAKGAPAGVYRGSYAAPPSRRCRFGGGWKCGW